MITSTQNRRRPQSSAPTTSPRPVSRPSAPAPAPSTAARSGDSVTISPEALAGNVDADRCGNNWRCLEKIWDQV